MGRLNRSILDHMGGSRPRRRLGRLKGTQRETLLKESHAAGPGTELAGCRETLHSLPCARFLFSGISESRGIPPVASASCACLQREARHRARQRANTATLSNTRATPHSLHHDTLTLVDLCVVFPQWIIHGFRQRKHGRTSEQCPGSLGDSRHLTHPTGPIFPTAAGHVLALVLSTA